MADDNEHISEHPPDVDIDQFVEDCNFRIERMDGDSVWLAAYTHDDEEPDHHYNIQATDDDDLHISHETTS